MREQRDITHLSKLERMRLGSFYTPQRLVDLIYEFIQPDIAANRERVLIFDNAAGFGAFMPADESLDFRAADIDPEAISFLKRDHSGDKIFFQNALVDSDRTTFNIPAYAFLIQVGNPPYNDTTSQFRNGQKGRNECDPDLFDRDLGISFLKSYERLDADVICVLHPLSYLIKQANFERLGRFKDKYRLKKGMIFSSSFFSGTGGMKFPIVIALYERSDDGMEWRDIRRFEFDVLDQPIKFVLSDYQTTDGIINKYPPRKNDCTKSPIDLYYYTFRDLNSLRKNASFIGEPNYNAIVVTKENFYQYAYLFTLKSLFQHEHAWLFGNLSPLVDPKRLEINRGLFVRYALATHPLFKKIAHRIVEDIRRHYSIDDGFEDIEAIEDVLRAEIRAVFDPHPSSVESAILFSKPRQGQFAF